MIQHEAGIHIVTSLNGRAQSDLVILGAGHPGPPEPRRGWPSSPNSSPAPWTSIASAGSPTASSQSSTRSEALTSSMSIATFSIARASPTAPTKARGASFGGRRSPGAAVDQGHRLPRWIAARAQLPALDRLRGPLGCRPAPPLRQARPPRYPSPRPTRQRRTSPQAAIRATLGGGPGISVELSRVLELPEHRQPQENLIPLSRNACWRAASDVLAMACY